MSEKRSEMVDSLRTYKDRSLDGLGRMRKSMQDALRSVKTPLDPYAEDIISWLPFHASNQAIRMGRDSGRLWRKGDYGDSLVAMGHAIQKPLDDALWLAPGAGIIKKVMK